MKALKVIPVSDMVHKQQAVLAMADEEPVILAQRSKGRAVLVSIEEWNRLQEKLEVMSEFIRADSDWQEKNTPEDEWVEADEMLDEWAEKHGVSDVTPVVE